MAIGDLFRKSGHDGLPEYPGMVVLAHVVSMACIACSGVSVVLAILTELVHIASGGGVKPFLGHLLQYTSYGVLVGVTLGVLITVAKATRPDMGSEGIEDRAFRLTNNVVYDATQKLSFSKTNVVTGAFVGAIVFPLAGAASSKTSIFGGIGLGGLLGLLVHIIVTKFTQRSHAIPADETPLLESV